MRELFETALAELGSVAKRIDEADVERACGMISGAGKIVLYGCGREGLQVRGLAMRLYHLGCDVAMHGDMAAPPVGGGDLFVATAGTGELATVTALMRVARDAGAGVLFLTAEPEAAAAKLADFVLEIPAQTMARDQGEAATSVLPMGSVFEGALFLLFEVMVLRLGNIMDVSAQDMRARHTNLE